MRSLRVIKKHSILKKPVDNIFLHVIMIGNMEKIMFAEHIHLMLAILSGVFPFCGLFFLVAFTVGKLWQRIWTDPMDLSIIQISLLVILSILAVIALFFSALISCDLGTLVYQNA